VAFIHSALRADGVVVRLDERLNSQDNSLQYAPVFLFHADDGQNYTLVSGTATSPASFEVGQHVQVLYRKGKPDGAAINSFWELWLFSLMLAFMGVVHGIISGVFLLIERKLDRRSQSSLFPHALRG